MPLVVVNRVQFQRVITGTARIDAQATSRQEEWRSGSTGAASVSLLVLMLHAEQASSLL